MTAVKRTVMNKTKQAKSKVKVEKVYGKPPIDWAAKNVEKEQRRKAAAENQKAVRRMTIEQIDNARLMGLDEARATVDQYYQIQAVRKAAQLRISAINRRADLGTAPGCIQLTKLCDFQLEQEELTRRWLKIWALAQPLGRWVMGAAGAGGGVVAAGLLTRINFGTCCCDQFNHLRGVVKRKDWPKHECPGVQTSGHLVSYAGLQNPELIKWEKGKRRPYDAKLKCILMCLAACWEKLVPSPEKVKEAQNPKSKMDAKDRAKILKKLNKFRTDPSYIYVRLLDYYKKREQKKNESGGNAEYARRKAKKARDENHSVSQEMLACWDSGKLQDEGVRRRAFRRVLGIFLSHYYETGMKLMGRTPAKPYAITILNHGNYIPPPVWEKEAEIEAEEAD